MKKENLISDVVKVQVGRRGIEYEGRHYWSPVLFDYMGMKVRCVFLEKYALIFKIDSLKFIALAHECKKSDFWEYAVVLAKPSVEEAVSCMQLWLLEQQIQELLGHMKKQAGLDAPHQDLESIESDKGSSFYTRSIQSPFQRPVLSSRERDSSSRKRY